MIRSENTTRTETSEGLVGKVVRQFANWAGNVVALDGAKWRRVRLYQDVLRLEVVQSAGVGPTSYGLTWDLHFNPAWQFPATDSSVGAVAPRLASATGIPVRNRARPSMPIRSSVAAGVAS